MRQSLQQRIAEGLEPDNGRPDDQARLVEDLARVLRETAAVAAATRPGGPADTTAAPQFALPQILQPKPLVVREVRNPARDWMVTLPKAAWGVVVSAPLTSSLAIVSAAMITLVWQGHIDRDLPSAAMIFASAVQAPTSGSVPVQSVKTVSVGPSRRAAQSEAPALIAEAESKLVQGEIAKARELLGRAALTGSADARFALAETFDPNVLAARDLRGVSADPATAKLLYEQALASGDPRAGRRLKALLPN